VNLSQEMSSNHPPERLRAAMLFAYQAGVQCYSRPQGSHRSTSTTLWKVQERGHPETHDRDQNSLRLRQSLQARRLRKRSPLARRIPDIAAPTPMTVSVSVKSSPSAAATSMRYSLGMANGTMKKPMPVVAPPPSSVRAAGAIVFCCTSILGGHCPSHYKQVDSRLSRSDANASRSWASRGGILLPAKSAARVVVPGLVR
jgi:hypothetical protein